MVHLDRHSETYESELVFSIEPKYPGQSDLVIGLIANGTYDQSHESVLNT